MSDEPDLAGLLEGKPSYLIEIGAVLEEAGLDTRIVEPPGEKLGS